MFFALSGAVPGLVATQSYPNTINVNTNSIIDVQNSAAATLGNLNIGTNTLSLTGAASTSLTLGATTLSGNPTFDVPADATISLGAVNDGGTARTITKQNAGALTFRSAAASLVAGTQINITAGTVNSNNATALGTLASVDIAGGTALDLGATKPSRFCRTPGRSISTATR